MARRSKEEARATRESILTSARYLFGKKGFSETKIAEICTRSKHTKGALFHYFDTKEILFETVWEEMEKEADRAAAAETAHVAGQTDDPYAAFLAGCRIFLEHVSRADFQQIVYIDGPSVLGMKKWMARDSGMGLRNIGAGLKYLVSQGLIEESNRPALTVLIYSTLHGLAKTLAFQTDDNRTMRDEVFENFETLIKSLR